MNRYWFINSLISWCYYYCFQTIPFNRELSSIILSDIPNFRITFKWSDRLTDISVSITIYIIGWSQFNGQTYREYRRPRPISPSVNILLYHFSWRIIVQRIYIYIYRPSFERLYKVVTLTVSKLRINSRNKVNKERYAEFRVYWIWTWMSQRIKYQRKGFESTKDTRERIGLHLCKTFRENGGNELSTPSKYTGETITAKFSP